MSKCPFCGSNSYKSLCVNPACFVDSNPKHGCPNDHKLFDGDSYDIVASESEFAYNGLTVRNSKLSRGRTQVFGTYASYAAAWERVRRGPRPIPVWIQRDGYHEDS